MTLEARTSDILRFGNFEVDLRAGQLRKQGKRIKLQEQPFQVLSILLQRPNDVVTREELRSQIWQQDTFVDFDNSLNTAINKLRDALGDSVVSPRFIETLPRRGYRFLAPVAVDGTPSLQMAVPTRDNRSTVRTKTLLTSAVQFGGAVLAIGVVASVATGWLLRHTSRSKSSSALLLDRAFSVVDL
jgi:DNA-binding winged helix-turn-helix (wHTH) protein